MNVVVAIDSLYGTASSGMQRVASAVAEGLAARGHHVTVLCERRDGDRAEDLIAGVRIVRYARSGGPVVRANAAARAIRAIHAETPIDVLNTHFAYTAIGPSLGAEKSVARVRTYHGSWIAEALAERPLRPLDPLRYLADWVSLRSSDRIVVLSDYARSQVERRFGVAPSSISVVPGGVDVEHFRPSRERTAYRTRFDAPAGAFIIAAAGRLVKRKGFDRLIDAFATVAAALPHAMLLIAGTGAEAERLSMRIEALRLSGRARLLGHLGAELPDFYRCADVLVVSSLDLETFGLVTVEALASGTPVIGTPVGATPEILRDLDPALIARSSSAHDIAARILDFASASDRSHLEADALVRFADSYVWARHVVSLEKVFAAAIEVRIARRS